MGKIKGVQAAGTYRLGDRTVNRMGFGAMRLAGRHAYGQPKDRAEVGRVLRAAIDAGVNHIDTSDFYGPAVVNTLIREELAPYADGLVIVTKIGVRRTPDRAWPVALKPEELRSAVEDNLRNLGLEALDVVNLRMGGPMGAVAGSIAEPMGVMVEMQREGKIRHIGLSNIDAAQLAEGLAMAPVVCVQNKYSVLAREDDEILEECATKGIAFVPYFPMGGGIAPLKAEALSRVAAEVGASAYQVALAWLLAAGEHVLLIPGTGQVTHLRENVAAGAIRLSAEQIAELDGLA